MSQRNQPPPTRIQIREDDSLPVILDQLREHHGKRVVLAIPDHCPLLLTATEFRTLKDVADREQVRLALHSGDRLRSQLASMFGIKNINSSAGKSSTDGWRAPQTMLGSPRAFESWKGTPSPQDDTPVDNRRRRHRGHDDQADDAGSMDYLGDEQKAGWLTLKRLGSIVAVLLVLGLIGLAAGWYYMPTVTVHATIAQHDVSSEVYYSVAAEGAGLPSDIAFTVPATQQSANVPFTLSIPVTGVSKTPDKTAAGEVTFRNPSDKPAKVPAGTELKIHAGTAFKTDAEVTVPAKSDKGPGEAKAKVTAAKPGADGNLERGLLTGKLDKLGVFYSNRDAATAGGTDIEVKVVTQEDVDTLNDKAGSDIQRASGEGWMKQMPEGQSVVVPSIQAGTPQYTVQNKVGDHVDNLTATGTVDVKGLVFDQATVDTQAREFFKTSLQDEVPEGYTLDPDSVTLSEPKSLSQAADNVQYQIKASATSYAVFDERQQRDLEGKLAGGSWGEAESALNSAPQFASWSIETSPGWWPKRFPQAPDRVHVEPARPATESPDASPTPNVRP